jgi:phospholipase C
MDVWEQRLSRGRFLGTAALALGGTKLPLERLVPAALPKPARSGIDHVVVVIMENRSFDHYTGWLRGADGRQAGLSYTDAAGAAHPTWALAPDFQGCAFQDPDHSYEGARVEWNNGACDGWLRAGKNDLYSIGYYRQQDLAFTGKAAPAFTTCDRFFASIMGPTFPNRFYFHSGVTDRLVNTFVRSDLPTIWDRLAAKKVRAGYYCGNVSYLLLWDQKYKGITYNYARFFRDCKTGKLPAFSLVDPNYTFEDEGPSSGNQGNDNHPHADIRAGEYFMSQIYNAVTKSPAWARTLLVFTFDEWGGFFDHVSPPAGPDVKPEYEQRGFRIPTILVSPFARRAHVDHGVYDHTSILRLAEWRWGLEPLSVRDAAANNLANALDFSKRRLAVPKISAPRLDVGAACPIS